MKIDEKTFNAMPSELQAMFHKLPNPGSDEVVGLFPEQQSGGRQAGVRKGMGFHGADGDGGPAIGASAGSAARFFYCAKASPSEREAGLREAGLREAGRRTLGDFKGDPGKGGSPKARNHHPTVKPVALMRYLCRLITPPGGVVVDPFAGSGTTGAAAIAEGMRPILIEREPDYAAIIRARLTAADAETDLFQNV